MLKRLSITEQFMHIVKAAQTIMEKHKVDDFKGCFVIKRHCSHVLNNTQQGDQDDF